MQTLYIVSAFAAVPYLIWSVLQRARGRHVGFGAALLAFIAVVVPLAALALNLVREGAQVNLAPLIVLDAAIVFIVSIVLLLIDRRKPDYDLNQSYGSLGLGVSMLLAAGIFIAPIILGFFPNAAANGGRATSETPGDVVANAASASATNDLVKTLTDQTGLTPDELTAQVNSGNSIASLVEKKGGDLNAVTAALTNTIQNGVNSGAFPQQILSRFGGDASGFATQLVNGQIPAQFQGRLIQTLMSGGQFGANTQNARQGGEGQNSPSAPNGSANGGGQFGGGRRRGTGTPNPVANNGIQSASGTATPVPAATHEVATSTPSPLPATSAPTLPTAVPTSTMTPLFIPTLIPQALGTTESTTEATADSTQPSTPAATVVSNATLHVNGACSIVVDFNLNLRASPGADGERLTTIPYTTVLEPTARTKDGWLKVNYHGQSGWVDGQYVTASDSCNSLPVSS